MVAIKRIDDYFISTPAVKPGVRPFMSREERQRQSPRPRFRSAVTAPGSGRRLVASVAGSSLQGGGLPAPRLSPAGALRRGREAVFAVSPAPHPAWRADQCSGFRSRAPAGAPLARPEPPQVPSPNVVLAARTGFPRRVCVFACALPSPIPSQAD